MGFFKKLLNAPMKMKVIENPIPHKYALELIGKKYDQLIQPYMFGEPESKATCLWIEGLPKLKETNNVNILWKLFLILALLFLLGEILIIRFFR
jgi:hypothetical protein